MKLRNNNRFVHPLTKVFSFNHMLVIGSFDFGSSLCIRFFILMTAKTKCNTIKSNITPIAKLFSSPTQSILLRVTSS